MSKTVRAQIIWTSVEDGGRKTILPVGMRYCPILVFDDEQCGDTLWSAAVYNKEINKRQTIADISYMADDAPHQLLQSGKKFFLFEGQQVVGEGIVCAD